MIIFVIVRSMYKERRYSFRRKNEWERMYFNQVIELIKIQMHSIHLPWKLKDYRLTFI